MGDWAEQVTGAARGSATTGLTVEVLPMLAAFQDDAVSRSSDPGEVLIGQCVREEALGAPGMEGGDGEIPQGNRQFRPERAPLVPPRAEPANAPTRSKVATLAATMAP